MNVTCEMCIEYNDEKKVKTVLRSIEVDNLDFVRSRADGKHLVARIEATSVSSLLHTLDDYLACVSVAEKVLDKS